MFCKKCGANLSDDEKFCYSCGAPVDSAPVDNAPMRNSQQMPNYQMPQYQQTVPNNRNNNSQLITLIIVIALIILVVSVAFTYMIVGEKGPFKPDPTPTPTPVVTVAPTQPPAPTPIVVVVERDATDDGSSVGSNDYVYDPDYTTFRNTAYGFSCAYPSNLQVYDDGGMTLYTVKNYDGSVRQLISAESANGKSVSSSMNEFISRYPGSVTYKTSGSDYYAVNINRGSSEHYRYCKFRNGNIYWFEFIYPSSQHDLYDMYINDIYSSMNIY